MKKYIFLAIFVLIIGVGVIFIAKKKGERLAEEQIPGYSVVRLLSGEVYVGKLTTGKRWELADAYSLIMVQDATDTTHQRTVPQLNPLADMVWAPKTLFVNPDQVIFWGPLAETSRIAESLKNAGKK